MTGPLADRAGIGDDRPVRIVIIGQAAFGQAVFERILDAGNDDVAGVFTVPDTAGGRVDPLKEGALVRGIPVHQPVRLRSAEAARAFVALDADLCVMAYVTDIVPMEIISAPRLRTIQYHPSLLPLHRGPSAINWAIINGDTRTGLTIFWPDEGLDTGPVLLQRESDIGPSDTVGSVYFDRLFPLGVDAMMEALDLVREGRAPRMPQDESRATYEGHCTDADALVDWRRPTAEVHNLIRGCDPQPGAHTTCGTALLRLYGSEPCGAANVEPGTVAAVGDDGIEIATSDGAVLVTRLRAGDGRKIAAVEVAQSLRLRAGDRLGGPAASRA